MQRKARTYQVLLKLLIPIKLKKIIKPKLKPIILLKTKPLYMSEVLRNAIKVIAIILSMTFLLLMSFVFDKSFPLVPRVVVTAKAMSKKN